MRLAFILIGALAITAPSLAHARHKGGDHSRTTDPNKVICRSQEVIGSRLQTQKTCHTAQEWAQLDRDVRDTVDSVQERHVIGGH